MDLVLDTDFSTTSERNYRDNETILSHMSKFIPVRKLMKVIMRAKRNKTSEITSSIDLGGLILTFVLLCWLNKKKEL